MRRAPLDDLQIAGQFPTLGIRVGDTRPPGLDARNIQRLITAISHASGQRPEGQQALMTAHKPAKERPACHQKISQA